VTELVTLSAQVPSDRVAEYFEMVAALNRLPADRVPELFEMITSLGRPRADAFDSQSTRPWSKGDEKLAKQVFRACSQNAQRVLSFLADRPNQDILGVEIAMALGMTKGHMAIAGTLGPIGIHCKKAGRDMPYKVHYAEGATAAYYVMSDDVGELFKAAAKENL
jgi:hypothetical protein